MNVARSACLQVEVAIMNIFTIIKILYFNNSLNNKCLVDNYYLILFKAFAFDLSLALALTSIWGF